MKLIFAGTPETSAHLLQALLNADHEIVAVYTQPDRPQGRGRKLTASPVKTLAQTHKLPIEQPLNFKQQATIDKLAAYQADAMVVVAYGLILPEAALTCFPYGSINVHFSLLPRWRGAAPIQHAILNGDHETGISIMKMEAGLDTGPCYQQHACTIDSSDDADSLHDKLVTMAVKPLLTTLENLAAGGADLTEQDSANACYAHKIEKQHGEILWSDTATAIDKKIRAYHPWPIAFTHLNDQTLRIYSAHITDSNSEARPGTIIAANKEGIVVQTDKQAISIQQVQLPGKCTMTVQEMLNAHQDQFTVGTILGNDLQ